MHIVVRCHVEISDVEFFHVVQAKEGTLGRIESESGAPVIHAAGGIVVWLPAATGCKEQDTKE
ncbi:hypothetical protein HMPREF1870_02795 [Bacteroidales bacterium KA00344]|nr:hypothetical protein HMPREF1870_02795 [Bacteroidales bacterium KA00344]